LFPAWATLFNDVSHHADAGLALPPAPKGRSSKWWDASAAPGVTVP